MSENESAVVISKFFRLCRCNLGIVLGKLKKWGGVSGTVWFHTSHIIAGGGVVLAGSSWCWEKGDARAERWMQTVVAWLRGKRIQDHAPLLPWRAAAVPEPCQTAGHQNDSLFRQTGCQVLGCSCFLLYLDRQGGKLSCWSFSFAVLP